MKIEHTTISENLAAPQAPRKTFKNLRVGDFFTTSFFNGRVDLVTSIEDGLEVVTVQRGTYGGTVGLTDCWSRTDEDVTLLAPRGWAESSTPPPLLPKTRKITAADIKPGTVFGWDIVGETLCLATVVEDRDVYGIILTEGHRPAHQLLTDDGHIAQGIKARLYPNARFDLGAPQTEIVEESAEVPVTRHISEVKKGDVFDPHWNMVSSAFVATADGQAYAKSTPAIQLTDAGGGTYAGKPWPKGVFAVDDTVTLLDPATLKPLTTKINSSRPVKATDIKPGDVFEVLSVNPRICTRVEDGKVWGVPMSCEFGNFTERGVVRLDDPDPVTLYPDAKVILGAPVTEIPV